MTLGRMQRATWFMRSVTYAVLIVFCSGIVVPAVQAAEEVLDKAAAAEDSKKAPLVESILGIKDTLGTLAGMPDAQGKRPNAEERTEARRALVKLGKELDKQGAEARKEFAATEKLIKDAKLPAVIQDRQKAALATFDAEFNAVRSELARVLAAKNEKQLKAQSQALIDRISRQKFERAHQEYDPENLPNGTLRSDPGVKPRESIKEFQSAGVVSNPSRRFAQAGPVDYSQLPGASNGAYLAATDEVVLSVEIEQKAQELNNDPVKIHEWVRNNVKWQPTWGSIQTSHHTLGSRIGNAFDIASLTIALMRAAGIPARYVHGTIDVPEGEFRNWAGNFNDINAAMEFASAGGIPIAPVTAAGAITRVRMEHVWVEVAADYSPSRAAVNRVADAWVPIDPSFKQMQYTDGLSPVQLSGVDLDELVEDYLESGTFNAGEAWGEQFDSSIVTTAYASAREQIEQYLQANAAETTVVEALGGERIVVRQAIGLPASLPHRLVATGATYAALPTSLQQEITFAFGKNSIGEPASPQTFAWAQLNGRRLTLSFRLASPEDRSVLEALHPQTEITNYTQIPSTIPGYLVRVVPELKLDGSVIMAGPSRQLGTEMTFVFNPKFAGRGIREFSYAMPAGAYLNVAVFAGSIARGLFDQAQAGIQETTDALAVAGLPAALSLTRDDIMGNAYYGGLLAYYGQYLGHGSMLMRAGAGRHILAGGLGTFGHEPKVDYVFGIPRSVAPGVNAFNVPIVNVVGHLGGNAAGAKLLTMQLGLLSSTLEHAVPEQIDPTTEAVSTVAAFEFAMAQGGRILAVDQSNAQAAIAQTQLASPARAEVFAAVATGKFALVHTGTVSVPGWSGSGYAIVDPLTGSGAYKISGGLNGGVQKILDGIDFMTAGVEGYLDVETGRYAERDIWFSERLKFLAARANLWSGVGYAGLLWDLVEIYADDTLSSTDKLLQISLTLLEFAISAYLTSAVVGFVTAGFGFAAMPLAVGLAAGIVIGISLAFLFRTIELIYLEARLRQRRDLRWI